jgi:hypothetical protein
VVLLLVGEVCLQLRRSGIRSGVEGEKLSIRGEATSSRRQVWLLLRNGRSLATSPTMANALLVPSLISSLSGVYENPDKTPNTREECTQTFRSKPQ